jgi:hypothetical protein
MRRLVATLALLLVGFTSVEPASFGLTTPNVPLCCQKNGKHHCAAMAQTSSEGQHPNLRIASPSCSYRNQAARLSAPFQAALNIVSTFAELEPESRISAFDPVYRHSMGEDDSFERGPPHTLFCSLSG